MEASNDNFLILAENTLDGVLVHQDGKHVFTNQSLVKMLGYETEGEIVGSGMEAIISNYKRGLDASRCIWKGYPAFQCFVMWNIITFNLMVIAKTILEKL